MCVNLPNKWVNFIFLRKFCKETRCFLEKFTQLEIFLHDRRSWRSRQISSLFGRYLLLSGFCRNGGLRGYPSANSREDGSPATWDCGNGGQLEGKLSLIYWRGCTYISVSKQNISFLKIKRCSPFLWGLIWRIPKGFLILTSFGGCTRPSKICLS